MHIDSTAFATATLQASPWGAVVQDMLAAAIGAVEPGAAVRRHMRREGDTLLVGKQTYELHQYERVFLVAAGKASIAMALTAADVVGARLTRGVVLAKDSGSVSRPHMPSVITVQAAAHPIPDERGVAGARQIAAMLGQATRRDLVLVLLSGGGSALLTLPAPGIALEDMQHLTTLLLSCGATINEINSLRKHLDMVKGGGVARMAAPATIATLILSDVVGNPLDVIASGPTMPDSTTFADAYGVLEHYALLEQTPPSILSRLREGMRGAVPETPGADDPLFAGVQHVLVGNNRQAAEAALSTAHAAGWHGMLLTTALQGEARLVGAVLASMARELTISGCLASDGTSLLPRPACIAVGGETTVTLRGQGRGGRNQELALAAVRPLAGVSGVALVTLATDGEDGPTDAAGAVVTGETLAQAQQAGLDVESALDTNDSYTFFTALGDALQPGPTGTNVNDLALLCAVPL